MIQWNKESFGVLSQFKASIQREIEDIDRLEQEGLLSKEALGRRIVKRGELEKVLLKEEVLWREKSRVTWVKEGDGNTKFFHKVANGKRNRSFINSLENDQGVSCHNINSILEEIVRFFGNLYMSPGGAVGG